MAEEKGKPVFTSVRAQALHDLGAKVVEAEEKFDPDAYLAAIRKRGKYLEQLAKEGKNIIDPRKMPFSTSGDCHLFGQRGPLSGIRGLMLRMKLQESTEEGETDEKKSKG